MTASLVNLVKKRKSKSCISLVTSYVIICCGLLTITSRIAASVRSVIPHSSFHLPAQWYFATGKIYLSLDKRIAYIRALVKSKNFYIRFLKIFLKKVGTAKHLHYWVVDTDMIYASIFHPYQIPHTYRRVYS